MVDSETTNNLLQPDIRPTDNPWDRWPRIVATQKHAEDFGNMRNEQKSQIRNVAIALRHAFCRSVADSVGAWLGVSTHGVRQRYAYLLMVLSPVEDARMGIGAAPR